MSKQIDVDRLLSYLEKVEYRYKCLYSNSTDELNDACYGSALAVVKGIIEKVEQYKEQNSGTIN